VEYRPRAGECDVDYAPKPEQDGADMARSLTFMGLKQPLKVQLNGRAVDAVAVSPSEGAERALRIALV
jgi:hypothetical protein